jgi:hypothetical protein
MGHRRSSLPTLGKTGGALGRGWWSLKLCEVETSPEVVVMPGRFLRSCGAKLELGP